MVGRPWKLSYHKVDQEITIGVRVENELIIIGRHLYHEGQIVRDDVMRPVCLGSGKRPGLLNGPPTLPYRLPLFFTTFFKRPGKGVEPVHTIVDIGAFL